MYTQTVSHIAFCHTKENNVRVLFVRLTHPRVFSFFLFWKKGKMYLLFFFVVLFDHFLLEKCTKHANQSADSGNATMSLSCGPAHSEELCCGHKKASHFWLSPIEYFSFWGRACHKNLIKKKQNYFANNKNQHFANLEWRASGKRHND